MLRVLRSQPVHHVHLGADGEGGRLGGTRDRAADVVGRARFVGRVDDRHGALGVHNNAHVGVLRPSLLDLLDRETLVHAAEAVPEDHARIHELVLGRPTEGLARVPHRHLLERHAHRLGGVAPEVLVGEEQHALTPLERPLEHRLRVRRRTHDAAVAAAEGLQRGRRVHIGDGDDRGAAIRVRFRPVDRQQFLPGRLDAVDVGHVGHRASGGEVREDHALLVAGEDVGRLGHEVHAAENDVLGVGLRERGVRQLKRIAEEVGVLHDLVALIEVAKNDQAVAQRLFRGTDAGVQFVRGRILILARQAALHGRARRNHIEHRRSGAVAGGRVELPRTLRKIGGARFAGQHAVGDAANRGVEGEGLGRVHAGILGVSGPASTSCTSPV